MPKIGQSDQERMQSSAFLTGSRAYGKPRTDSDYDLVVLVSQETLQCLQEVAEAAPPNCEYDPEDACCLRFGPLNLLCVCSEKHFELWQEGTEELIRRSKMIGPVQREFAIEFLRNLRKKNGIKF